MKLDFTEVTSPEDWELFARDFLAESSFVIETPPGRGADAGKDILISEQLRGQLATVRFAWLVSCKHFATSGKSVGLDDELSISDRLRQHGADGFMGFYSTIASSPLVERTRSLVADGAITRFEFFDHRKIEARLLTVGMSKILARYFPRGYAEIKPIQRLFDVYVPLNCEICGKDVLQGSLTRAYSGNIVTAVKLRNPEKCVGVYAVCKGECDRTFEARLVQDGCMTLWEDITDLLNPIGFLKNLMAYVNILHTGIKTFTPEAHAAQKHVYMALAQCTLREATAQDHKRILQLLPLEGF